MNLSPEIQEENPNILKYLEEQEMQSPEDNILVKEMHSLSKHQFYYLISISSTCERYDDVLLTFESLFSNYQSCILSSKERSILETALKTTVSSKEKKLNKLDHLLQYSQQKENDLEDNENHQSLLQGIRTEKNRISKEIVTYAQRVLCLIDDFIMKIISINTKGIDREAEVFYSRMKGDIYKYLSQVEPDDDSKQKAVIQANNNYNDAYKLGGQFLPISNKVYLRTVLSYANFLLFVLNNKAEAELIIQKVLKNDFIKDVIVSKLKIQLDLFDIVKEINELNEALINNSIVQFSETDDYNES